MKNDGPAGSYIGQARERMQTYVRHLLHDNESLRLAVAELESERSQMRQEIAALQQDLASNRALQGQLVEKIQDIRGETDRRFAEYAKLETLNANLANLYVASYQLHSTLDRETVLAAIQEIIVNLIGSEEFAVFESVPGGRFRLAASVGLEDAAALTVHERVAHATASGETFVAAQHGELTACIPLKIDGGVTGFIVICRLLAHKSGLEPLDLELFDLLGTHAAMALYVSSLQQRFAAEEMPA